MRPCANTETADRLVSRRRFAGALLALPLAAHLAPAGAQAPPGIDGLPAPELSSDFWIDANGRPTTFRLAAHRGKWVHLKFWQSWCPGCHAHGFPALQKMIEAFAGDPRVVNVAVQTVFEGSWTNTREKVRETQLRYRLPIVMGHASGEGKPGGLPDIMRAYRSGGTPWHVLVSPKGIVEYDGFRLNAAAAIARIRESLAEAPA